MLSIFFLHTIANCIDVPSEGTSEEVIQAVLCSENLSGKQRVFFVDLGTMCKQNQDDVLALVNLILYATLCNWFVVVSTSSGQGWINLHTTSTSTSVSKKMVGLQSRLCILESRNFSNEEAEKYSELLKIDKIMVKKYIQAVNNPLVLSYFSFSEGDEIRFNAGMRSLEKLVNQIIEELLLLMDQAVFSVALDRSLRYLLCAVQETPIPIAEMTRYNLSYLSFENLTSICDKDTTTFTLKINIPNLYPRLIDELKDRFSLNIKGICESPIVKGLVFESRFLQNDTLNSLTVATNSTTTYTFPALIPAPTQLCSAVDVLVLNQLNHLRPGHPAIDGVCLAKDINGDLYILLIQVSLSHYSKHTSKAIDIHKSVVGIERSKRAPALGGTYTIATYYQSIPAEKINDENVIYVYASPEEIQYPVAGAFFPRVEVGTKSSKTLPKYKYGFIAPTTPGAELLS